MLDVKLQNSEEELFAVREGVEVAFEHFANIDVSEVFECQLSVLNDSKCNNVDVASKSGQDGFIEDSGIDELFVSDLHLDVPEEYIQMRIGALQLKIELSAAGRVLFLLQLHPIVCDFSGEVAEEGGVGAKKVQGTIVVFRLCLQMQEIFLPKRLVVAVGDQRALVNRAQKFRIARMSYESNIISPCFDVATEWSILVQGRKLALELISQFHVSF